MYEWHHGSDAPSEPGQNRDLPHTRLGGGFLVGSVSTKPVRECDSLVERADFQAEARSAAKPYRRTNEKTFGTVSVPGVLACGEIARNGAARCKPYRHLCARSRGSKQEDRSECRCAHDAKTEVSDF